MSHSPAPWRFVKGEPYESDSIRDSNDDPVVIRAPKMLALLRKLAVVSYDAELGRSGPGCSECGGLGGHIGPCQLAKFLAEIEVQT